MSRFLIIVLALGSSLAAGFLGSYIGRKYVRGRISTEWVLALNLMPEYIFWVAVFLGCVAYGATNDGAV
jgi:predicted permease